MRKGKAAAASPLSSFFRNHSEAVKHEAYSSASVSAIESQKRVIEEAKAIKEKQSYACA